MAASNSLIEQATNRLLHTNTSVNSNYAFISYAPIPILYNHSHKDPTQDLPIRFAHTALEKQILLDCHRSN
jgi:hypothetical protein